MDGILDRLAAVAFPVRCPGCGRPGAPVCGRCLAGVRPAPPAPPPLGLVAWSAAFAYEGVVREAVARAKYHGSHASLRGLGDHAASAWHDLAAQAGLARPDVVTWAPTAPARRRARGVDHARVLAQVVAARLGVPAVAVLARPDGPAQTVLPAAYRRAGPPIWSRRPVEGVVLLVDDVATTGGTARACAGALLHAGAREVTACTIARTPPGRH